ncbi:MAG: type IV secretion system protein [Alphaproteobacteria bacterium]
MRVLPALLVSVGIFSAGSVANAQTGTVQPPRESTEYYWAIEDTECDLCEIVDLMALPAEAFGLGISNLLQPIVVNVWFALFGVWFLWSCLLIVIGKTDLPKFALMFLGGLALSGVLQTLRADPVVLTQAGALTNTGNAWFDIIYVPIRDFTVGASIEIVRNVVSIAAELSGTGVVGRELPLPPNAAELSRLAQLFGAIEIGLWNSATLAFAGYDRWGALLTIPNLLAAIILALPFIFVLLIFAAFILESAFKFLAVTALSPLWIGALFFPFSRPWTMAAIRMYFSAAFTIMFAAMAMGFTLGVIEQYRLEFACIQVEVGPTCQLAGVQSKEDLEASEVVTANDNLLVATKSYWIMLFVGFVSVLLHLKAPNLAANISGANDSAAPAAAVVAAGKMAAFGAVGATGAGLGGAMGVPAIQNAAKGFAEKGGVVGAGRRAIQKMAGSASTGG